MDAPAVGVGLVYCAGAKQRQAERAMTEEPVDGRHEMARMRAATRLRRTQMCHEDAEWDEGQCCRHLIGTF